MEKFCLLLIVVFTLILGVESSAQWRVTDFPHPVYQSKQCGRKEASWICDPNGIVSTEDADAIQEMVTDTYEATRCPCPECATNNQGYVIMVAIMPRMYRIVNRSALVQDVLYDARVYSYYLSTLWNVTTCDTNTLVLYSRDDDITYIMTWRNARALLDDNEVRRITLSNRFYFDDPTKQRDIGKGLRNVVRQISEVFRAKAPRGGN
ncbi:uncharacterized protein LOC125673563 [Ostrea edulis]|uniref:uncharacterized protein LOC125673563 n=1 Tax=Ostrea edulis TaxID=37623 RepID=UPI002094300A|nr:uncharacterized protein LOC125673563 [Ostrea edulis]